MKGTGTGVQLWTAVTEGDNIIILGNDSTKSGVTTSKTLTTFENESDLESFVNNLKSDDEFYKQCIETGYDNKYMYPSLKYPELNPVVEN
jgi:hypothetical protein